VTDSMEAIRKLASRRQKGKVLAIVNSHDKLGDITYSTGYWIPELAHPYLLLDQAGYEVGVASPKVARPRSMLGAIPTATWRKIRFVSTGLLENHFHNRKLLNTKRLAAQSGRCPTGPTFRTNVVIFFKHCTIPSLAALMTETLVKTGWSDADAGVH
jgi:putative intracellular protease/amidase